MRKRRGSKSTFFTLRGLCVAAAGLEWPFLPDAFWPVPMRQLLHHLMSVGLKGHKLP